jgi:hypothetical protein
MRGRTEAGGFKVKKRIEIGDQEARITGQDPRRRGSEKRNRN